MGQVVRMRLSVDVAGRPLRKDGPCYICNGPAEYRFSAYHHRYGDVWLNRHFADRRRLSRIAGLTLGYFRHERLRRGKQSGTLKNLLAFVCENCRGDLERIWAMEDTRFRELHLGL